MEERLTPLLFLPVTLFAAGCCGGEAKKPEGASDAGADKTTSSGGKCTCEY